MAPILALLAVPGTGAAVVPALIVAAPILVAVFVLVVKVSVLRHRQLELQNADEAAALAGANALVDDFLLTNLSDRQDQVVANARGPPCVTRDGTWSAANPWS